MSRSSKRFRERLDAAIKSNKTTITELHKITGISRNSIYGYLAESTPDLDALDKIADALGLDPADAIKPVDRELAPTPQEIADDQTIERIRKGLQTLREKEVADANDTYPSVKKNG